MTDVRKIFAAIRHAIQASTPATWPDRNFSCEPNSLVEQPVDWIQSQSRTFRDFCLHIASYPMSANAYCFYSIDVEVLIFYPFSVATDELQILTIEDAVTVQNAIGRHPESWGGADSISFLNQQPYVYTTVTDDNADAIAQVFAIPMRIEVKQ